MTIGGRGKRLVQSQSSRSKGAQMESRVVSVSAVEKERELELRERRLSSSTSSSSLANSQGVLSFRLDFSGNKCGKCQNHEVEISKKGHARDCPFKRCECLKCRLLDARSDILQVISGKETKLKGTKKDPNCGFCQNHGIKILRKGHVRSCGFGQERHFKLDNCFDCEVHYIRNEVNRLQIKMRRAMKEDRTLSEEQRKTAREAITKDEVEKVCDMARLARKKREKTLCAQQLGGESSALQLQLHNQHQHNQQNQLHAQAQSAHSNSHPHPQSQPHSLAHLRAQQPQPLGQLPQIKSQPEEARACSSASATPNSAGPAQLIGSGPLGLRAAPFAAAPPDTRRLPHTLRPDGQPPDLDAAHQQHHKGSNLANDYCHLQSQSSSFNHSNNGQDQYMGSPPADMVWRPWSQQQKPLYVGSPREPSHPSPAGVLPLRRQSQPQLNDHQQQSHEGHLKRQHTVQLHSRIHQMQAAVALDQSHLVAVSPPADIAGNLPRQLMHTDTGRSNTVTVSPTLDQQLQLQQQLQQLQQQHHHHQLQQQQQQQQHQLQQSTIQEQDSQAQQQCQQLFNTIFTLFFAQIAQNNNSEMNDES